MPFELFSDRADVKMKVSGKTLQGLFKDALRGVAFYLKPETLKLKRKDLKEKQKIKIQAADINSLLVEFLSKIIAQADIVNTVFVDMSLENFGENFLEGELAGVKVDALEQDIKAVSYEEVDIKKSPTSGRYETILVLDT